MTEGLRSILLGTSALSVAFAVALVLTVARPMLREDPAVRERVFRLLLLGIGLQCFHVIEEFSTGLYIWFPTLLGLQPWSPEFFVAFNLCWIAVWIWSVVGLRAGMRAAMLPVWFFALGMAANGVVHPLLAVGARGYFPGLVTSPAVGIVGVVLMVRLLAATRR